ncbi:MAG: carboxypeptidase regulatory-like domain-containing protein [Acidobacteria bacterium]|nr:carboxypeptidase regulatory-like domain-containing protein [Acidobacteriota bacterium]
MAGESASPPRERIAFLADGAGDRKGSFAHTAPVPRMDWVDSSATGLVAGIVESSEGKPADGAMVVLKKGVFSRPVRIETDGNGWFGSANLKSGKYKLWAEKSARKSAVSTIEIKPREVNRSVVRLLATLYRCDVEARANLPC